MIGGFTSGLIVVRVVWYLWMLNTLKYVDWIVDFVEFSEEIKTFWGLV
jgi:hypothetical protein